MIYRSFFQRDNETTAFARIKNGKRIFGVDDMVAGMKPVVSPEDTFQLCRLYPWLNFFEGGKRFEELHTGYLTARKLRR